MLLIVTGWSNGGGSIQGQGFDIFHYQEGQWDLVWPKCSVASSNWSSAYESN